MALRVLVPHTVTVLGRGYPSSRRTHTGGHSTDPCAALTLGRKMVRPPLCQALEACPMCHPTQHSPHLKRKSTTLTLPHLLRCHQAWPSRGPL